MPYGAIVHNVSVIFSPQKRMCSFRGSYANRGNETELSSSDVLAGLESPAGTGRLRRRRRNRPAADRREIGTIDTKRPGPRKGARASWCECS